MSDTGGRASLRASPTDALKIGALNLPSTALKTDGAGWAEIALPDAPKFSACAGG
jgi:hypothetical protein